MRNWKSLFRNVILERGYDYYMQGLVEDYQEDNGVINATVCGSEDYEVDITLINGKLDDAYCSCPYAEDGNYCKHMAAVLFEYEEKQEQSFNARSAHVDQTVEEIVDAADELYIRDFLITILNENALLRQRFTIMLPNKQTRSVDKYKQLVDATIRSHTNHSGYVNYHDAADLIDELMNLSDDINIFIESGQLLDAFELSCYIMQETQMADPDNEDVYLLYDNLVNYWYKIAAAANTEEKDTLFKELVNGNKYELYFFNEYIKPFLLSSFRDTRYMPTLNKLLDNNISSAKHDRYKHGNAILQKLTFISETEKDYNEIEKICLQYWESDTARRWLAQQYEQRGKITESIRIYEESLNLDFDYPGLINQYREKLLRLYQQTENYEEYRKTLWYLVTDGKKTEYYRELKSCYTENEWSNEREKVFQCYSSLALADLYSEEKLYDKLWEILKSHSINTIMGYENVLLPIFDKEILNKYEMALQQQATMARDRSTYQYWVRILRRMNKIEGGNKIVDSIVKDWQIRYKNRRAMMEELNKL